METYVILRRSGWRYGGGARRGGGALDRRGRDDGRRHRLDPQLRARGARRPRRHGLHLPGVEPGGDPPPRRRGVLPVDEIIKVADTVLVRPDPVLNRPRRKEEP